MKIDLLPFLAGLTLLAGCRSTPTQSTEPSSGGASHSTARAEGDAELEALLEIANARLVSGPSAVQAEFVLKNKSDEHQKFEFLVEAYGRAGDTLPGGRTAWVALELAPKEERGVRTAALPQGSESWRLVARRIRGG